MGDGLMDRVDVIMRRYNMQNKSRGTLCNVNYNNCNMRVNVKANRLFIYKDCLSVVSSGNATPQEIRRNIDINKINNVIVNGLNQVIPNTSLKVVHQNIRGLRNKYNKLYCHLSHDHPHIICM
jgi:hypothetical protein